MKAGIDTEGGSPKSRSWARAADGRDLAPRQSDRKKRRIAGPRPAAIQVKRRFRAPPALVFEAWLDPRVARTWLFATALRPIDHVEIDARVGGSFCFVERENGHSVEYTGRYLEIIAHQRLVFTLSMELSPPADTRVTVEIAPVRQGCELKLTHERVPGDRARHVEDRWTGILYGLAETLEPVSQQFSNNQE